MTPRRTPRTTARTTARDRARTPASPIETRPPARGVVRIAELDAETRERVRSLARDVPATLGTGSPLLTLASASRSTVRARAQHAERIAQMTTFAVLDYASRAHVLAELAVCCTPRLRAVKHYAADDAAEIMRALPSADADCWRDVARVRRVVGETYANVQERRGALSGLRARSAGQRAGVPDVALDAARGGWFGLRIELKIAPNRTTAVQRARLAALMDRGYLGVVCTAGDAATLAERVLGVLAWYAEQPPTVRVAGGLASAYDLRMDGVIVATPSGAPNEPERDR